jgi:cytochrome c-type biogenesis protein CcmH
MLRRMAPGFGPKHCSWPPPLTIAAMAMTGRRRPSQAVLRRCFQAGLLSLALFAFLGAGDESRFSSLGHRLMCVCSCNQILLECNHVGCPYSDRMRGELMAGLERGENDDLTLQGFVQKYGPTVMAAPTTTGFNRVAWIMPFLVLGLGLSTTVLLVRSWRKRPAVAAAGEIAGVPGPDLERFRAQARKDTEI